MSCMAVRSRMHDHIPSHPFEHNALTEHVLVFSPTGKTSASHQGRSALRRSASCMKEGRGEHLTKIPLVRQAFSCVDDGVKGRGRVGARRGERNDERGRSVTVLPTDTRERGVHRHLIWLYEQSISLTACVYKEIDTTGTSST